MLDIAVRIGPRGRITIPAVIRKEMGLSGGDRVDFRSTPQGIVILKRKKIGGVPEQGNVRRAPTKKRPGTA